LISTSASKISGIAIFEEVFISRGRGFWPSRFALPYVS
jgi:hypothetical protein